MTKTIVEFEDDELARHFKIVLRAMGLVEVRPNEFEEIPEKKPSQKVKQNKVNTKHSTKKAIPKKMP